MAAVPFGKSSDKIGNHEDLYGLLSERKPEGPILTAPCSTRNPRLDIIIDNGSTEISTAPRSIRNPNILNRLSHL
jgi:hypothetical protein